MFQEALELECEESRIDLLDALDNNLMTRDDQYDCVMVNKVTRRAYEQFFGDSASETIIKMCDHHGLLVKEEEE